MFFKQISSEAEEDFFFENMTAGSHEICALLLEVMLRILIKNKTVLDDLRHGGCDTDVILSDLFI